MEADKAKEEAKYNSQSVTVITKEDIARKQGKSVEDVIFNEVGVTRTVDAMGKVGISIRGADPRHTLIMVDGQPVLGDVSKYSGNGDELMRIGAENIERIEIIRGAASAKYGADAIGGVVNVITKQPKDNMGIEFNAEGRYHNSRYTSPNETSALPSNFYLRADSGKVGNFKAAAWTSKRDILPVYAKDQTHVAHYTTGDVTYTNWEKGKNWYDDFKPSLRFYGKETSSGMAASYEFNQNHKIDFRVTREDEDVERRNKTAWEPVVGGSFEEPMRISKRTMKRDNYAVSYTGKGGNTDWKLDVNHGETREDDSTILAYSGSGHTAYSGSNTLASVDWLEHRRTNINANFNTYIGDTHVLTYGMGYTKETAEGSRLKNSPKTHVETIDPWDYDKSLYVPDNTAGKDDVPASEVHNFKFVKNDKGFMWDRSGEYYGGPASPLTYEEAVSLQKNHKTELFSDQGKGDYISDPVLKQHYQAFKKILDSTNDYDALKISLMDRWMSPLSYFGIGILGLNTKPILQYNGKYYGQDFEERNNQLLIGEAELKKTYAYVQDNWQITKNTMITPSLRIDHSDLFGSKVTGNMGLLHNLNGNPHRRFKANIGTGYAEPGMGELYYNWEMYGGTSDNHWGWYWIGNPDLKPETSLNFDISLEGESNKTFAKVSLFHNEIKDYLTSYFTGQLIDFNFDGSTTKQTPDRIYSFRNLGKAKITGLEAEVQQKFNDHWSAKVGYTLLHAVNASDEDMPHKLLDKPTHKFDVSLNYENKKGGVRGALWGSYYMDMLDSNSVTVDDTWGADVHGIYTKKKASYNEKSFGIWNFLLEKDFGKDLTAYVGVDNIFDHRDDDRAFQDRVYRFGVNIKLADLGEALSQPFHIRKDAKGNPIITNVYGGDWFLSRPIDLSEQRKAGDVRFFGDYHVRSNMFKGENKVVMRETKETYANTDAAKNHADLSGHGLEQRLRVGADYQIADGLNLQVVGSTAKRDTSYNVADQRGLHDPYLEKAELTKSTKKWDWSVGRISEPMGVTGYWFGKEYDGARIVYTDDKTQVSLGYGDFSQTTGITDSAYNHKEFDVFYRSPTVSELLGYYLGSFKGNWGGRDDNIYPETFDPNAKMNYREKFNHAGQIQDPKTGEWKNDPSLSEVDIARKKLAVVNELVGILENVDKVMQENLDSSTQSVNYGSWKNWKDKQSAPASVGNGAYISMDALNINIMLQDGRNIPIDQDYLFSLDFGAPVEPSSHVSQYILANGAYGGVEGILQENNIRTMLGDVLDAAVKKEGSAITCYTFIGEDGKSIQTSDRNVAMDHLFAEFVGQSAYVKSGNSKNQNYGFIGEFLEHIAGSSTMSYNPTAGAPIPLPGAPQAILQTGYVLKQDVIPAMDRAAYIKVRRQLSDTVGVEAWKLNSFGQGAQDSHGLHDMQIADVLGIGTQIRLGKRSMLSFDYGQNRSDMGKFFHGGRDAYGDYSGGHTPDFWVARLDIGIADTDMPGSWHAYLDYKAFDHGSFVGGTGADLPDRYLDGIRSFTTGIGYVPARNLLLEASYTFGAKSTQMRDTLYTPENFRLGDYTRVQMTYKF
ncbi:TonB-dependent receptor plug domain-containing protein [Megasphaera cerevisiae]|uniref:TonB-dependent receptor plug domain-containing protein n=1 Tax=Megasphaera cerevisiae TaxID=39029 RepID=UPI000A6ED900|nr:TonB-dependent receptor [Megasphaera cerevisiae]